MAQERLQKYLARCGLASRRAAEAYITEGRVTVNRKKVTELGTKVDGARDLVTVDGKLMSAPDAKEYYLLYKPPQVVTTLRDPQGRKCVGDLTKRLEARVFPVGRLDFDAEGALLLTTDGVLANRLMHPRFKAPRTYLAKVKGVPEADALEKLVQGVRLEDGVARAEGASLWQKAEKNTWVLLTVTEGRHHLVKRMLAAIGHPVARLFRPAQAGISVKGMRPGHLRPLSSAEVARVTAFAQGEFGSAPELFLPARRHGRTSTSTKDEIDASE